MDRPILLCGLGLVGWRVLEHLRAFGHPIVAIDTQADPADPRLKGDDVRLVRGDCRQRHVLEEAGVADAYGVLVLTSDDLINLSAALKVRRLNKTGRVVVRMFNQSLISHLDRAVPDAVALSVSGLAAPRMARRALVSDVQASFQNPEKGPQHVVELTITDDSPLLGKTIAEVFRDFRLLSVAHQRPASEPRMLLNLDYDARLAAGDTLTVSGKPSDVAAARAASFGLGDVLWAGKLVRAGRVLRQTLLEVDLSVKIAGAVLAFVLFFSILIYHYLLARGWIDSLYSTISVMLTEESLGADEMPDGPRSRAAKIFVSFMKFMSVVLIAAFTAIFTNFLIRARLDRALEVRRIPDGGHIVVCGLGSVGFRIVEELLAADERVVVIEMSPVNNFAATCRRQKVPVIIGDGGVEETLRQAHVMTARAVVAATSDDLANLEFALLVRQLNPNGQAVVRLSDPALAESLREQGNMPRAVSVPALAAPAFVAALFEDRVQTVFRVGEQELVVVDLVVEATQAKLVDQFLRVVATDYNLIPVGVTGGDPEASRDSATYRLQPGDRVTVFTTPADLARLVGDEPVAKDWSVRVTGFPVIARADLITRLCTVWRISREDAARIVGTTPFVFAEGLTRGEAEEWTRLLRRERVQVGLSRG